MTVWSAGRRQHQLESSLLKVSSVLASRLAPALARVLKGRYIVDLFNAQSTMTVVSGRGPGTTGAEMKTSPPWWKPIAMEGSLFLSLE